MVYTTISDWIREQHPDLVIIDNLMALNLDSKGMDKYEAQSMVVKMLSTMAKEQNVHVHFICHPRKSEAFLRKGDISGTSDLTNVADNVFMVHRVSTDFLANYRTVYPKVGIPAGTGNVIEIMKNRDRGVVDQLIMLYFDSTCRTMSDVKGGLPMHGWSELFIPVNTTDHPFEGD